MLASPAAGLCIQERPIADGAEQLRFDYNAPSLAHFARSDTNRENWVFDGKMLRPKDGALPPGQLPNHAAPELPNGIVLSLINSSDETGEPVLGLYRLNDARREFEPIGFLGPSKLRVTDMVLTELFGGDILIGGWDGVYGLNTTQRGPEIGAYVTEPDPGPRHLTPLPGRNAVLVVHHPRSADGSKSLPPRVSLFTENGLVPFDLPLSSTGFLLTSPVAFWGMAAASHPPALVYAEGGRDGATAGYRLTALEGQGPGVTPGPSLLIDVPGVRLERLGGAIFALGQTDDADIGVDDIRIFDGAALRPLTEQERGDIPARARLMPVYASGTTLFGRTPRIGGLSDGRELFTYDPETGFTATQLSPDAPAASLPPGVTRLWYAPAAALSIAETGSQLHVIGPGGGRDTVRVNGVHRVRIVPRYGEILILDDTGLRVASAGPCGP